MDKRAAVSLGFLVASGSLSPGTGHPEEWREYEESDEHDSGKKLTGVSTIAQPRA